MFRRETIWAIEDCIFGLATDLPAELVVGAMMW
jgi:hypothetical protein